MIETIISLISQPALGAASSAIDRSERIQQVFRAVGISTAPAKQDFNAIYVHALVEYGLGKPEPILRMWRDKYVREAFQASFLQGDPRFLEDEIDSLVARQNETGFLGKIDYDLRRELDKFVAYFNAKLDQTRSPYDARLENSVNTILDNQVAFVSRQEDQTEMLREALEAVGSVKGGNRPEYGEIRIQPPAFIPDYYVERTEYLDRIATLITSTQSAKSESTSPTIVGLSGIGGTGKSMLIRALPRIQEIQSLASDGVLWIDCNSFAASPETIVNEMAIALGIAPQQTASDAMMIQFVRNRLSTVSLLVVADHIPNSKTLAALIDCIPPTSVAVAIARTSNAARSLGIHDVIEVRGLSPEQARELVEKRIGSRLSESTWHQEVEPLLQGLGFHALATSLAAASVSAGESSWSSLKQALSTGELTGELDFDDPDSAMGSLRATFAKTISDLEPDLRKQLEWLSVLALGVPFYLPDAGMLISGMPEQRDNLKHIETDAGFNEVHPDSIAEQTSLAESALLSLARRGLVERIVRQEAPDVYFFHPVIQYVARNFLREAGRLDNALVHHAWVYTTFTLTSAGAPAPIHSITLSWGQIWVLLERAWATLRHQHRLSLPSVGLAESTILSLVLEVDSYLTRLGETKYRVEWLQRALKISREKDDHASLRMINRRLGRAHFDRRELDLADTYYTRARQHSHEAGYDDTDTEIRDLVDQAIIQVAKDTPTQSIATLRSALLKARNHGDSELMGIVLGTLAHAHIVNNEPESALPLYEEAIQIAFDTNDQFTLGQRMGNMGLAFQLRGRNDLIRARDFLHRSRITAIMVGNLQSHANHLVNLANIYSQISDEEMALACIDQAISIMERFGSPNLPAASSLKDAITNVSRRFPETLEWGDIFEHAEAALRGDRISELRLRKYAADLSEVSEQLPDLAQAVNSIVQMLDGETNVDEILGGLDDHSSMVFRILIMNLRIPGLGSLIVQYATQFRRILQGLEHSEEEVDAIKRFLESQPPENEMASELLELAELVFEGERDINVIVSEVSDPFFSKSLRLLLELGPDSLSIPDYFRL